MTTTGALCGQLYIYCWLLQCVNRERPTYRPSPDVTGLRGGRRGLVIRFDDRVASDGGYIVAATLRLGAASIRSLAQWRFRYVVESQPVPLGIPYEAKPITHVGP